MIALIWHSHSVKMHKVCGNETVFKKVTVFKTCFYDTYQPDAQVRTESKIRKTVRCDFAFMMPDLYFKEREIKKQVKNF